jgi:hypothetical protein
MRLRYQTEWQQSGLAVRRGDLPIQVWLATGGPGMPETNRQRAVLRAGRRGSQVAAGVAPQRLDWSLPRREAAVPRQV